MLFSAYLNYFKVRLYITTWFFQILLQEILPIWRHSMILQVVYKGRQLCSSYVRLAIYQYRVSWISVIRGREKTRSQKEMVGRQWRYARSTLFCCKESTWRDGSWKIRHIRFVKKFYLITRVTRINRDLKQLIIYSLTSDNVCNLLLRSVFIYV